MSGLFNKNVFVNCPFDKAFAPLLRPLIFTILHLGFHPRLTLEQTDAGESRIAKILRLISECRYAIHDLSRCQASRRGEIFRLNMPFELGLDIGCKTFRGGRWKTKKCLILEAEKYRYQAALSDLSNSDILVHMNQPKEVVAQVRNWLTEQAAIDTSSPTAIWADYLDFMEDDAIQLQARRFSKADMNNMPVPELLRRMQRWIEKSHRS
jgi:hypothetical protein